MQLVTFQLPGGAHELGGHIKHSVELLIDPAVVEYVLAGHSTQDPEPFDSLNLPSVQARHGPPSGPVKPGLQVHADALPEGDDEAKGQTKHALEPTSEYVLMGQGRHSAEPDASLNLPAAHAKHGPPSFPVYPLLHVQLLASALPDALIHAVGSGVVAGAVVVLLVARDAGAGVVVAGAAGAVVVLLVARDAGADVVVAGDADAVVVTVSVLLVAREVDVVACSNVVLEVVLQSERASAAVPSIVMGLLVACVPELLGQSVHACEPASGLNLPSAHTVQFV
jgi:hypothetical protein